MEGCVGEESFQMWELNRRLEAYLARVKALEEQNELLSAELGGLRAQSGEASWRARADDELAALRALVDQRWREMHAAELERDSLAEELEGVAGRCQQLRLARERLAEEAARSRRAVEAERCARGYLSNQAAELERELEALRAAHEEERASLNAQAACAPRGPPAPARGPPAPAPEVEELAKRLGEAWRGAVRGYQERVAHMETSLGQARERLGQAVQGVREGRLELQQLQAERSGLQERREALEQRLESRWQERLRATEKFQLAVEALEQEKQGLQGQIAQVLEGRQQLVHLKMSLSLEVATYRTLLEAENSRLQTPGGSSKASLSFQDPKLELRFPGTPEGRLLGPLLPVLSPPPLPFPLPNILEPPTPVFLKSQEFLQARTPTLASTPIPITPQAPCPATDVEAGAQDAPVAQLQPQGERQQAPEPLWEEAKVGIPACVLPGPEEPGGAGQVPEDQTSLAPPLSPDYSSLEAKDGEPSGSRVSDAVQEQGAGQIWGLVEKEAAIEVKSVNSLQKKTQQEDLDNSKIQDSWGLLGKETPETLGEEIQEPPMFLEKKSHEILEKEDQESLTSLEEENLETLKSLEEENQELSKSLEEKKVEAERLLEKGAPEILKHIGKEDPQTLQSLEEENQEQMSLEGNLETVLFPETENQDLVRSLEEEKLESLRALEKENQQPLRSEEAEEQESWRSLPKEQESLWTHLDDENGENFRLLEKENQELLRALEKEDQKTVRLLENEKQETLQDLEKEDQKTVRPLESENQEPLRDLEKEDQETVRPLESENQEPLRDLEKEDQETVRPLEIENQETLRDLEKEDQKIVRPLENENQETLRDLEKEDPNVVETPGKENQETLRALEEDQSVVRTPENENQETLRDLEEENPNVVETPGKENQETLRALEEDQSIVRTPEKENQEPLWALDKEDQRVVRTPEKENQEPLRTLEDSQEILRPLEKETEQPLRALEEENKMILRPLEKLNQEPLESSGKDQELVSSLEKENQELFKSLKGESAEAVRSLEPENPEPLKSAGKEDLEILESLEAQELLWPQEEMNRGMMKPLEKEIQEPLGSDAENQEILRPLAEEVSSPSYLGEQKVENLKSPEEAENESQNALEEEESLREGENQELLRSLENKGQGLQSWEDVVVGGRGLGQGAPTEEAAVENEAEPELGLSEQDAEEEAARPMATGDIWSPGSPGPQEQRALAEGASRTGGTEGLQDPIGQPEQMGAYGGTPEVIQDMAPGADRGFLEVTVGSETGWGESAAGAQLGLGLEQKQGGLEDPVPEGTEPACQREGSLEAQRAQALEALGKDPEKTEKLEEALSNLPRLGKDPQEPPESAEGPKPEGPWAAGEGPGETEAAEPVLGSPSPAEPWLPPSGLGEALGPQPHAEGGQEAGWGLQGGAEALGRVGQEELVPGEISEDLQEEGEESREESEADELGETLPDSTPLGLYFQSPASPRWDLVGEQRPSPQGEARKEGWDTTVPAAEAPGAQPSEEEGEGEEEEEQGRDSDLSEEFEDLATEASLLPGAPGEVAEPLGQVPRMLKPEVWDRDGESDGFADEEESGEEGEEEEEEQWRPGSSVSSLQALSSSQKEDLLEPETVGVSVPWESESRGTALDTESQDSTGPPGSEESDSVSLERDDHVPRPLKAPREVEGMGPRVGDTIGVNGRGPNLDEESEHVNGSVNGLERSQGEGQGTLGVPDGDQGIPFQEEDGSDLKVPWSGAPIHLGPRQYQKFTQREGDQDSWSSGED